MHQTKKGNQWYFGMKTRVVFYDSSIADIGYEGKERRGDR